ncbi:MAG: amino acid permease, partial [Thermoleophilaceae bacterium]
WINPVAVVFVCLMFVILMLPFSSLGVPWESDFDWSFFNYTPLVVGVVLLGTGLAWVLGAKNTYKGPVKTLMEDEATAD